MKMKRGDNVIVIAGLDKGKKGKIIRLVQETDRVLVEGINLKKKHQRPKRQGEKGQIVEIPHPIHRSNVSLFCPNCNKGVKLGAKILSDKTKNKKIRVCRKCGKEI